MATYNDLYMRRTLNDDGETPLNHNSTMWHSPDIVPLGLDARPDIVKYLKDNWNSDLGQNISIGKPNYIYIRGKNLRDGEATGKVHLYYCSNALLLYPNKWKDKELITGDTHVSFVSVDVKKKNDLFACASPFVFSPEAKPTGKDGDHYCFIARVETDSHPNLIPDIGDIDDFSTFILSHPGWAWRNTSFTNADIPTFNETVEYNQGTLVS